MTAVALTVLAIVTLALTGAGNGHGDGAYGSSSLC